MRHRHGVIGKVCTAPQEIHVQPCDTTLSLSDCTLVSVRCKCYLSSDSEMLSHGHLYRNRDAAHFDFVWGMIDSATRPLSMLLSMIADFVSLQMTCF
jgi:hypothetical protein